MNTPTVIPVTLVASVSIAVGAGLTIYTDAIDLSNVDQFSVGYKVACTGVPNVKIEIEQCMTKPTANAADVTSVVPETFGDIVAALTDKNQHLQLLEPICTRYMRFKITEQTGIVADTVLTMNLSMQNKFGQ